MPRGIAARIGIILLIFILLVAGSAGATTLALRTLKTDAVVINLAGRQRMLIQEMALHTLGIEEKPEPYDEKAMHVTALQDAAERFDQTLDALIGGGEAPYLGEATVTLPAATDPVLLDQLATVHGRWLVFRGYIDTVLSAPPGSSESFEAILRVQALSSLLVAEADAAVRLFEAVSEQKIATLRAIQVIFFGSAVTLLVAGYWITRRTIIQPVRALQAAARRMAGGDLDTPIVATDPDEIGQLARSLDITRRKLAESRHELERWAATLETRVADRTRELAALFEVSAEITSQLEIEQVLNSVMDKARNLLGMEVTILCLLDAEGKVLRAAAFDGPPGAVVNRPQTVECGLVACVVDQGQTIRCGRECGCTLLQPNFHQGHLTAPLRAGERIIGALCVAQRSELPGGGEPPEFIPEEVQLLTLLANSAAIAIAKARLVETGRRQAEQAAALAERERLAAELHDYLAQTLSFLNLKTDRLKEMLAAGHTAEAGAELDRMKPAIDGAYGQVRAALVGLREPATTTNSPSTSPARQALAEELAACLADFREASGLPADLTIADSAVQALPHVVQRQALHIVREALINVRRHAQANRVWVCAERVGGETRFTVEDDGRGFDPASIEGNNHLGLTIMRARAKRSGGHLVIDSTPGAGTKVVARFLL